MKMGIVPCHTDDEPQSDSNHSLHLHSESSSLSSQPSLPSLPSLTPQGSLQQQHHHHHHHATTSTTTSPTYHCISTLKGHSSHVFSLAIAGKFLYTGSCESEIRAWHRHPPIIPNSNPNSSSSTSSLTQNNKNVVAVGKGAVKSLVISGDKVFSGHQDHKIRVWSIDNMY